MSKMLMFETLDLFIGDLFVIWYLEFGASICVSYVPHAKAKALRLPGSFYHSNITKVKSRRHSASMATEAPS